MKAGLRQRFLAKVVALDEEQGGCWEWLGYRTRGYGVVHSHGWGASQVMLRAHRVSYELFVAPIRDGAIIRHTCDNPGCVNPDHLLSGTHTDNARDKFERGRCPRAEHHASSRLTRDEAHALRRRALQGERLDALAVEFGTSIRTAYRIRNDTRWKGNA